MGGDRRFRVLWITDEPPDRAGGGGNIRQAHLLLGLCAAADVDLVVLGAVADRDVRAAAASVTEVPDPGLLTPRRRSVRRLVDLWLAVVARGPWEVALSGRRRRAVRAHVESAQARVDLVVASHPSMAALLPRSPTVPWVAQIHHVSSVQARQERAITGGRRQRWLLEREEHKARRFESAVLGRFERVVVVSDDDAAALGLPAGRAVVAPNGVDTTTYSPTARPDEPTVLLSGSFQYLPNADGARWFCDEVLPRLRRTCPKATVALVGRAPTAEVLALGERPGVSVHADVPAMAPWLAAARASVVPLRIGTGSRLKALEAMAAGRPVVGTTVGLSGLDVVPGVHVLVADGAEDLAGALTAVLLDDELAARLVAAGRALAVERYEWSAIAARFAAALLALAPDAAEAAT